MRALVSVPQSLAIESGFESFVLQQEIRECGWVLGPKYTRYILYQVGEEGKEMRMDVGIRIMYHLRRHRSLTHNNSPKNLRIFSQSMPNILKKPESKDTFIFMD